MERVARNGIKFVFILFFLSTFSIFSIENFETSKNRELIKQYEEEHKKIVAQALSPLNNVKFIITTTDEIPQQEITFLKNNQPSATIKFDLGPVLVHKNYKQLLKPFIKQIKEEALKRNIPPELLYLALGTEENYRASSILLNNGEEFLARRISNNFPLANKFTGIIRDPEFLTLGITQKTPNLVKELSRFGKIPYKVTSTQEAIKLLLDYNASIVIAACYFEYIYETMGIYRDKRSTPENLLKAWFAYFAYKDTSRFEAFRRPLVILEAILGVGIPDYPRSLGLEMTCLLLAVHSGIINFVRNDLGLKENEYSPIEWVNNPNNIVIDFRN